MKRVLSAVGAVLATARKPKLVLVGVAAVAVMGLSGVALAYSSTHNATAVQAYNQTQPAAKKQSKDAAAAPKTSTEDAVQKPADTTAASTSAVASSAPAASTAKPAGSAKSTAATSPTPFTVPVTYVQPLYDTVAQTATLSLGNSGCNFGSSMYSYSYWVTFNSKNKGGNLAASWEVEQASNAIPDLVRKPYFTTVSFSTETVAVGDTINVWSGLTAYQQTSYRIRLVVTSPTVIYSNWIDIPVQNGSCQ